MPTPCTASGTIGGGDAVCITAWDGTHTRPTVSAATAANLASSKTVFGVAASDPVVGVVSVLVAGEVADSTVTGLTSSTGWTGDSWVITTDINNGDSTVQQKLIVVPNPTGAEHVVGTCDENGNLAVQPRASRDTSPRHVFNVCAYGGVGDGSTDNVAAITSAIAAMPSSTGVLLFPQNGTYVLASDPAIPSTVQVEMDEGAVLAPATGVTCTILGRVRCHPNQYIFGGLGAYAFGPSSFEKFNIKNFGPSFGDGRMFSDGTIDVMMSNITVNTTTTTFTTADVGKAILIEGAGFGGANLITTIATFLSSTSVQLTIPASVSVTDATCFEGTDTSTAINTAISAMPSTTGVLLFPQTGIYVITSDTTIPITVQIELDEGAILSPFDGATITINGRVRCHPNQWVFGGLGSFLLGPAAFDRLNVKNFGAMGDGTTDDIAAFEAAIASIPIADGLGAFGGATIFVPPGVYYLSKNLRINRQVILAGAAGQGNAGATVFAFEAEALAGIIIDSRGTSFGGTWDWAGDDPSTFPTLHSGSQLGEGTGSRIQDLAICWVYEEGASTTHADWQANGLIADWTPTTPIEVGQLVFAPLPSTEYSLTSRSMFAYYYECIAVSGGGNTGSSPPFFSLDPEASVTWSDGTAYDSGQFVRVPGIQNLFFQASVIYPASGPQVSSGPPAAAWPSLHETAADTNAAIVWTAYDATSSIVSEDEVTWVARAAPGITFFQTAYCDSLIVTAAATAAFELRGTITAGADVRLATSPSYSRIVSCQANNCGVGAQTRLGDSNASTFVDLFVQGEGGIGDGTGDVRQLGIIDASLLGNRWISPKIQTLLGPAFFVATNGDALNWDAPSAVSAGTLVGPYIENGCGLSIILASSYTVAGGGLGDGIASKSYYTSLVPDASYGISQVALNTATGIATTIYVAPGSQTVLGQQTSDDSGLIAWSYQAGGGARGVGWNSLVYAADNAIYSVSGNAAVEGAGNLWVQNGVFYGYDKWFEFPDFGLTSDGQTLVGSIRSGLRAVGDVAPVGGDATLNQATMKHVVSWGYDGLSYDVYTSPFSPTTQGRPYFATYYTSLTGLPPPTLTYSKSSTPATILTYNGIAYMCTGGAGSIGEVDPTTWLPSTSAIAAGSGLVSVPDGPYPSTPGPIFRWQAGTPVPIGYMVRPKPSSPARGLVVFQCIVPGVTGDIEPGDMGTTPAWPTTSGAKLQESSGGPLPGVFVPSEGWPQNLEITTIPDPTTGIGARVIPFTDPEYVYSCSVVDPNNPVLGAEPTTWPTTIGDTAGPTPGGGVTFTLLAPNPTLPTQPYASTVVWQACADPDPDGDTYAVDPDPPDGQVALEWTNVGPQAQYLAINPLRTLDVASVGPGTIDELTAAHLFIRPSSNGVDDSFTIPLTSVSPFSGSRPLVWTFDNNFPDDDLSPLVITDGTNNVPIPAGQSQGVWTDGSIVLPVGRIEGRLGKDLSGGTATMTAREAAYRFVVITAAPDVLPATVTLTAPAIDSVDWLIENPFTGLTVTVTCGGADVATAGGGAVTRVYCNGTGVYNVA